MSDAQLDRLKYIEKAKKNHDGSRKNFITGGEIDQYDRVDRVHRRDSMGIVVSMASNTKYRENFDKINWGGK